MGPLESNYFHSFAPQRQDQAHAPSPCPKASGPPTLASFHDHPLPIPEFRDQERRCMSYLQRRDDASGHLEDGTHGV